MSKPQTLIELLEDRARHDPSAEAFLFQDQSVTHGALLDAVERAAAGLLDRGLERGARVVIALPNGLEFFALFYGTQKAGGVPVPTFPGSGAEHLERLAGRCGAQFIVTESGGSGGSEATDSEASGKAAVQPTASGADMGEPTARDLRGPERPGVSTASVPRDARASYAELRFKTLAASALLRRRQHALAQPPEFPEIDPDDLAYIQFTSGTTGYPKGVQLSHRNVVINIGQLIAGFEITSDDVFVSWLPAYHDMGLVLMTMVPFALGARLVLLPASLRSIRPWLEAIAEHRGTFTAAPDFGYRAALRLSSRGRGPRQSDISSLRVALNAAEPVRAGTIEGFEKAFGLESVMIAGYGLAEATVGVSSWTPGRPPKVDSSGSVSVGKPFPEVEAAILGEDGLLDPNQPGEILVKSPANTRGYWTPVSRILSGAEIQQVEADRPGGSRGPSPAVSRMLSGGKVQDVEAETSAGEDEASGLFWNRYVRTGDMGYVDDEGDLFVSGRIKQMIIQAGRNIAPREVEEIVDALPLVRRSAAVGVDRGDDAGEQLYVFAEMRGHARPDDATCRERVVAIVDAIHSHLGLRPGRAYLVAPRSLPFTANGKVRYGELKGAYGSGRLRDEGRLWYPGW